MDMTRKDFTGRGTFTEPRSLEPYRSREFFELEQAKVFDRAWLFVAREEELPETIRSANAGRRGPTCKACPGTCADIGRGGTAWPADRAGYALSKLHQAGS